jgi:hypothetical protein
MVGSNIRFVTPSSLTTRERHMNLLRTGKSVSINPVRFNLEYDYGKENRSAMGTNLLLISAVVLSIGLFAPIVGLWCWLVVLAGVLTVSFILHRRDRRCRREAAAFIDVLTGKAFISRVPAKYQLGLVRLRMAYSDEDLLSVLFADPDAILVATRALSTEAELAGATREDKIAKIRSLVQHARLAG